MLNKYLKKPLSCVALAYLVVMGGAATVNGADTLAVTRSFDIGSSAAINGLAFGVNGGSALLYGMDSNHSLLRIVDIAAGSQSSSISLGGTFGYGVGTGAGDHGVEYYVASGSGGVMRYNPVNGEFPIVFWLTVDVKAVESANASLPYADMWALNTAGTDLVRFAYSGGAPLQVISGIGTGLTDLAVDTAGGRLYALGGSTIYQYSTAGDLLTTYALDPAIVNPVGIAYDSVNKTLWISNGGSTLYELQQIPEASTSALLIALLIGVPFILRRRCK